MPDVGNLSREELRELATSENIVHRLVLANSGWAPLSHLECAGELKIGADDARRKCQLRAEKIEQIPEERRQAALFSNDLSRLTLEFCDATDAAFEAALNAAWEFVQAVQKEKDRFERVQRHFG